MQNVIRFIYRVLRHTGLWRFVPDRIAVKILYRVRMKKKLNLNAPETFNEKLQWLKLYDRRPEYTTMVDKYEVKQFVADKIGAEYIIPTLGVWDRFEDIDFDVLPDQFVLKCTHDSGGLVVCRDKRKLDIEAARAKINKSLQHNYYWHGREWPYKNVKPRIIAEQYLEQEDGSSLTDYKFFCFNGSPQLLYVSIGLENHSTAQIGFYDINGKEMTFHRNDYKPYHHAKMPDNFDGMKIIANKLANKIGSTFVRIDLYSINDQVYFSEITFSPCSGMIPFEPASTDEELGRLLHLPIKRNHLQTSE